MSYENKKGLCITPRLSTDPKDVAEARERLRGAYPGISEEILDDLDAGVLVFDVDEEKSA